MHHVLFAALLFGGQTASAATQVESIPQLGVYLPRPIAQAELDCLADMLRLSEEQQEQVERLWVAYQAECVAVRGKGDAALEAARASASRAQFPALTCEALPALFALVNAENALAKELVSAEEALSRSRVAYPGGCAIRVSPAGARATRAHARPIHH